MMERKVEALAQRALDNGATPDEIASILHNRPDLLKDIPVYQEAEIGQWVPEGQEFDTPSPGPSVATGAMSSESVHTPGPTPLAPEDGATVAPETHRNTGVPARRYREELKAEEKPKAKQNAYDVFKAANLKYNAPAAGLYNFLETDGLARYEVEAPLPFDEYSPFDDSNIQSLKGYPPHIFTTSRSPNETARIMRQYDEYNQINQTLEDSGAYGTANIVAAGVFQPISLIPLYGFTNHASRASLGFLSAAGTTAAAETLNEIALGNVDLTRTAEEQAINVIGASIFAGTLGGILGKADAADIAKAEDAFMKEERYMHSALQMERDMRIVETKPGIFEIVPQKLKDYDDIERINNKFMRTMARVTPIRVLASANALSRKAGALLGEQTVVGSMRHSIETLLKHREGELTKSIRVARKAWGGARKESGMKYTDFEDQVVRGMRNGDVSDNPHVQSAINSYRKIINKVKKRALETGTLKSEDLLTKFADSYFPRMYNFGKIKGDSAGFQRTISDWLKETNGGLKQQDADDLALEIYRSMTKNDYSVSFQTEHVAKAGPLQGRKLAVPDNTLHEWLINEPEAVVRQYIRHVGSESELNGRFSGTDLKDELEEIDKEWVRIIRDEDNVHAKRRHERNREKDRNDIMAMRDRILGRYRMPEDPASGFVRIGRLGRNLAALTKLGGMTLSAIPDVARPLWKHHMGVYFKAAKQMILNSDLRNMAVADLQRMGVGLDLVHSQRLQSIAEMDYSPHNVSWWETGIETLAQGRGHGDMMGKYDMGRVSLMSYWNSSLKIFAGTMSQDQFIMKVMKPQKYAADLARGSIDPEMAKRIASQYKKHGSKQGNLRVGNSDQWDDIAAAEVFEQSILKEVDATIVTPGAFDRPLWMSYEIGKSIGSMRSFAFASTNKQLLAGLNHMDMRTAQGVIASTAMGAMSLYVKGLVAGKTDEEIFGGSGGEFMWDAMIHSGALGIGSELSDIAMAKFGDKGSSYLYEKRIESALLGPVVGTGFDVGKASLGDTMAMRRLIPYNNHFMLRRLFDRIHEEDKVRFN